MKERFDLIIILIFCLVYRMIYFGFINPTAILYNSDSVTYFAAVDIFKGIVNLYRTPVYPYIIEFFEYFSKDHFLRNLIFFQQIVSFASVIPFYHVSKHVVKNRYLVIFATLFYGCWHYLIVQNININPESLCIAGSVFLLFLIVSYIEHPGKYLVVLIGLLAFILIMLKPTYFILLGIVPVFLIMRFFFLRAERKILYFGLIGWLIAAAGVLGYCDLNRRTNGEFVLSNVLLNDTLVHVSYSGAYREGGDAEFKAIIDANRHKGPYTAPLIINNDYIRNYLRCYEKFPGYLKPTGDMIYLSSLPDKMNYSFERIRGFVHKSMFTFTYLKYMIERIIDVILAYGNLFILLLLETVILICAMIRHNKIAWAQWFCILFVAGQFFTVMIGGVDNLDRLLIPSYPFVIQIAGSFAGIAISTLSAKGFKDAL